MALGRILVVLLASLTYAAPAFAGEQDSSLESKKEIETPPSRTLTLGTGGQALLDSGSIHFFRLGQRYQVGRTTVGAAFGVGFHSPQFGPMTCCDVAGGFEVALPLVRTGGLRFGPYFGAQLLSALNEGKTTSTGFTAGPSAGLQLGLFPRSVRGDLAYTTLTVGYVRWFGRELPAYGESGLVVTLEAALAFF
jgi:hypothetical protein